MLIEMDDKVSGKHLSWAIENKLLKQWDKLTNGKLMKKDQDRVYIVDGRERTGKSVFTFQQAKYLDPTFNIERICFTPEEFLNQIRNAPQGSVVVFDEAFRGLSSKASQSKVNKKIVQAMMEVGQRNLIIFIVLPTIFLLEIYPAVLRSNCLFHVYQENSGRRCFKVYNYKKKSQLYNVGKKKGFSYSFPSTKVRGRFSKKYTIDEEIYRAKKLASLRETDVYKIEELKEEKDKKTMRTAFMIRFLHEEQDMTYKEIANIMRTNGDDITDDAVYKICNGGSRRIEGTPILSTNSE